MSTDTYHHGDLKNALLDAVGEIIEEKGVGAVSLRGAARRAGVSHSAPAHHFDDKRGMLTAFAARGYRKFGAALAKAYEEAAPDGPDAQFAAIGMEYLRFAVENRGYFEVMFRPEMVDAEDPEFEQCSHDAFGVLLSAVEGADPDQDQYGGADSLLVAISAWANVHGLATLWLNGALANFTDAHIYEICERIFEAQEKMDRPPPVAGRQLEGH